MLENFDFAGVAAAAFTSARNVWMRIFGGCRAMLSPGNARTAAIRMVLEINELTHS